jgi:hypothetical protein
MLLRSLQEDDAVTTPTGRPALVVKRLDADRLEVRYTDDEGGTADLLEYQLRPSYRRGPRFRSPR